MKRLWISFAVVIFFSCSPEKRIQRLTEKFPHLLVADTLVVHDTIVVESVQIDTTTIIVPQKTVEVINNERVRLVYNYDTITKEIHHEVECKTDTVIRVLEVPVETIQVTEAPKTNDWKFWALIVVIVLGLVAFLIKGR